MNQTIHFPDREWWDDSLQAVCFPVMVSGIQLSCAITGETLCKRYGAAEPAITLFRCHRWDLEDEAEQRIRNQEDDETGWVWLS